MLSGGATYIRSLSYVLLFFLSLWMWLPGNYSQSKYSFRNLKILNRSKSIFPKRYRLSGISKQCSSNFNIHLLLCGTFHYSMSTFISFETRQAFQKFAQYIYVSAPSSRYTFPIGLRRFNILILLSSQRNLFKIYIWKISKINRVLLIAVLKQVLSLKQLLLIRRTTSITKVP